MNLRISKRINFLVAPRSELEADLAWIRANTRWHTVTPHGFYTSSLFIGFVVGRKS